MCRRAYKEAEQACAAAEKARRTAEDEAERLKAELGLAREQTVAHGAQRGATPGEPHLVQRIVARLEVGQHPCLPGGSNLSERRSDHGLILSLWNMALIER